MSMNTGRETGTSNTGRGSTGASNLEYDFFSVIYHALKGNENLEKFERDAAQSGDNEAAQLFKELRESNKLIVDKARGLLVKRLGQQR